MGKRVGREWEGGEKVIVNKRKGRSTIRSMTFEILGNL